MAIEIVTSGVGAESGMTAFEIQIVESCCSLRIVPADLFRPFTLIEIQQECAMSSRSRSGFDTELSMRRAEVDDNPTSEFAQIPMARGPTPN